MTIPRTRSRDLPDIVAALEEIIADQTARIAELEAKIVGLGSAVDAGARHLSNNPIDSFWHLANAVAEARNLILTPEPRP